MTKTLTEQWCDGTLEEGWYYVVIEWDDEIRMLYFDGDYFLDTDVPLDNDNIKEVLAPVLPYRVLYDKDQGIFPVLNIVLRNIEREQCRRKLTDLELSIKSQVKGVLAFNGLVNKTYESFGNNDQLERLQEQLNEKGLWIGVLKSHLEECWEIIKLYAEHDYLTPEDFYMRDRLESYYRRAGLGNIEDAKKLLEKWGVK